MDGPYIVQQTATALPPTPLPLDENLVWDGSLSFPIYIHREESIHRIFPKTRCSESQTQDVQQLQDSESTAPGQLSSSEVLNLNSSQLLNWLFMEPGRQKKRKKAAAELVLPYANPK